MDEEAYAVTALRRIGCALLCVAALTVARSPALAATSVFEVAPTEPRAVTVQGKGDGRADDTDAIQRALDKVAESPGGGIVFLPSGRYRISRTILVWPSVRLLGTGRTRPTLLLGDNTPGFQTGIGSMVVFTGARRGDNARGDIGRIELPRVPFPPPTVVPFDPKLWDANPSTFYSAMSNVDIEIGAGNPAATGIRFRIAQHGFLSHMDFRLGSGFAGIYQAGNVVQHLRFFGGRYGIVTEKPSPAWPFTVIDSTFEGQRSAAIREHEAGLTLVNVSVRDVPVGIEIDRGYGDWLWGKDVRFERVRRAAVVISNENNVYTQVGFDDALASDTPVFAEFRDSKRTVAGKGRSYRVTAFSHGLAVPALGQLGQVATEANIEPVDRLPKRKASAIRLLPPVSQWTNARESGVVGDGQADDTAALQRAIDSHKTVYLPLGVYKVTDTIRLRPDSVLIALHPSLTQIALADNTPAYQGVGGPKALVQSAEGGDAIVSGVGLFTGGINPRATALLWSAGENSLVDDVRFEGGHGGPALATGVRANGYNANHSGDADPARRWDGQYPSLWVRGGGGTFNGIWSPNTYASAGLYVSDTNIPGHVYQISVEHHVRNEIVLNRVANWELLAPQTEEEYGEGRDAVSLEIRDSRDLLIANYHGYRVTRTLGPAPAAVRLYNVRDIRFRNVHVNAESGFATCDGDDCATFLRLSKYPFENAIEDVSSGLVVREREFARLDVSSPGVAPVAGTAPRASEVKKLVGGFGALGGGIVDSRGTLYFVDRIFRRIHSWSAETGLGIVSSHSLDPVNLAVDRSDHLLVLSSDGHDASVYSLDPQGLDGVVTRLEPQPAGSHPNADIAMPVNWWANGEFRDQYDPARDEFTTLAELFAREVAPGAPREYVSPDKSLVLPAFRVFHQGPPDYRGWRFSHSLDTYGFAIAKPGTRLYVSNGSEARTYSATVGPTGALQNLEVFAERGGESVVTDAAGRVYVANGQIFVYAADRKELGRIEVPERPLQLIFGGANRQTLFILTHRALYSMEVTPTVDSAATAARRD
ncbi:glycosyl hydrolase family 28-related protein [Peristeroidobacter soli]|uniref:glycosyl hydrolase family 28-related protein n=1 Tax=Peristeroidobacter soli TaxID=2497877 RepID=UPI00101C37D5